MSSTIRVIVTDEEIHDIPVKSYEELTVEDWLRIHDGHKEGEEPFETLHRVFGLETRIARVMKMHEIYGMLAAYTKYLNDGKDQWAKANDISRILAEEDEETGQPWSAERMKYLLNSRGLWRETIEVEGQTFHVAQDIDLDGNYGQLIDLKSICQIEDISETARYPMIMAVYCLKEGEGYGPAKEAGETAESHQSRFDKWSADRRKLFRRARMVDAQAVCAFFFSSSDVFRETTHRVFPSFHTLKRLSPSEGQTNTASAGASTPN